MKAFRWIQNEVDKRLINQSFLVFLVLFMNVKVVVKISALIVFCLLRRKHFSTINFFDNPLSRFYFSMVLIALFNILLQLDSVTGASLLAAGTGVIFWLLAALASFACYHYVETSDTAAVHTTLKWFFVLNTAITFLTLLKIIAETGAVNPYTFQGMYQKYFIMTGDYMRGISFDTSTNNAFLNAFGVIYFLSRQKAAMTMLCMTTLLLTGSNLTNILLVGCMAYLFLLQSNRDQKSMIVVCLCLMVTFLGKISPQNSNYLMNTAKEIFFTGKKNTSSAGSVSFNLRETPDSLLNTDQSQQKFALLYLDSIARTLQKKDSVNSPPAIPKADIHSIPFQRDRTTTPFQKQLVSFARQEKESLDTSQFFAGGHAIPGKVIAFKQTGKFLLNNPGKLVLGNGTGNFSSKLAFRTTGLNLSGAYPSRLIHINEDFRKYHLAVFLYFFRKDAQLHSIINTPNSAFNQIAGEYGLAGLACFLLFFVIYFIRRIKYLSYGIPLMMIMAGAFVLEYWFEQLSIVVIFELMMFLNIREHKGSIN